MLAVGGAPVHRLTLDDVLAMDAAGLLPEGRRLELEEGVLVDVTSAGSHHEGAVAWLNMHFGRARSRWEVRVASTMPIRGGYLLPDLLVVEPLPRSALPRTARLAVEVTVTSHARDRHKVHLYASALVDEYWTVDLAEREVVVHRAPGPDGYTESRTYHRGETIEAPEGIPPVDVAELLG